ALIPTMIFLLFISVFGLTALAIGLFLNGRVLIKKESRRLANSLTFILGIFLLLIIIFRLVNLKHFLPDFTAPLYSSAYLLMIYFFLHVTNFLTAYFLY